MIIFIYKRAVFWFFTKALEFMTDFQITIIIFLFSFEQLSMTCLSGDVSVNLFCFILLFLSRFNRVCHAKTNWFNRKAFHPLVHKWLAFILPMGDFTTYKLFFKEQFASYLSSFAFFKMSVHYQLTTLRLLN